MANRDFESQVQFSRLRNNVELYVSSATQVLRDLDTFESSQQVLYNWDYSIAAGMLWSSRPRPGDALSASNDLDYISSAIFSLYPRYSESCAFKLTVSPPTILELLRALLHKADEYARIVADPQRMSELKDAVAVATESEQLMTADAKKAAQFLSRFSDVLKPSAAQSNFASLGGMIRDEKIASLTKIYGVDRLREASEKSRHVKTAILTELLKIRQRHHGEDESDFLFRNVVDASNISSTIGLDHEDKGRALYFLGPTPKALANLKAFNIPQHTRQPFTAFLRLISLAQSSSEESILREARSMTEKIIQRAFLFQADLNRASAITDMISADRRELRGFLRDYIDPIFKDAAAISRYEGGYAGYFRDNPQAFRDRFKEVEEELRVAAKEAIEFDPFVTSSEVLECFDLKDDPVVQGIYKRLGVA